MNTRGLIIAAAMVAMASQSARAQDNMLATMTTYEP